MERVAFLVDDTGARIGCLLNPETLVVRRTAGVQQRYLMGRPVTGAKLSDDPLLYTGGGTTELTLDLLFDVTLAGSTVKSQDVRDLTRPLWGLAENAPQDDGYGRPPVVRFVWGKSWNIPGVITAVAERLEFFTPEGAPRRSWLRLRMIRIDDTASSKPTRPTSRKSLTRVPPNVSVPPEKVRARPVLSSGGGSRMDPAQPGGSVERIDEIASEEYGDPSQWRLIASFNDVDDPMHMPEDQTLGIPDLSFIERFV
ncbi:MAG: hypothetical protein GY953_37520 [bacterium]|nr:hypothetical protein [bacterium]